MDALPAKIRLLAVTAALAAAAVPAVVRAECDQLTRPLAARVSAAVRPRAPDWARPMLTPAALLRFDSAGLHSLTYFLGYSAINLERVGTGGARPYTATVVVKCRGGRAQVVDDPYAWANARARELHVQISNAEQAAGLAAEVASLSAGRRPDAANATRRGPVWVVHVSLAAQATAPAQQLDVEIARDGTVRLLGAPQGPSAVLTSPGRASAHRLL